MNHEMIPIQQFVNQRYLTPSIQKLVETWRVEPQVVIEKLVDHFCDMGIFQVPAGHETVLMKSMLGFLKGSPEIMQIVMRARHEELKRQRNRHAE